MMTVPPYRHAALPFVAGLIPVPCLRPGGALQDADAGVAGMSPERRHVQEERRVARHAPTPPKCLFSRIHARLQRSLKPILG